MIYSFSMVEKEKKNIDIEQLYTDASVQRYCTLLWLDNILKSNQRAKHEHRMWKYKGVYFVYSRRCFKNYSGTVWANI